MIAVTDSFNTKKANQSGLGNSQDIHNFTQVKFNSGSIKQFEGNFREKEITRSTNKDERKIQVFSQYPTNPKLI